MWLPDVIPSRVSRLWVFLVLYFLSPFCHPSVCNESYTSGLTVVSLSTPGTTLAVPWGMNVNPALETLGNLSLMGSEEGKMVEKRLWKVFTALCVALQ